MQEIGQNEEGLSHSLDAQWKDLFGDYTTPGMRGCSERSRKSLSDIGIDGQCTPSKIAEVGGGCLVSTSQRTSI